MSPPDDNAEFETLLDFLRRSRGFDFTGYKRPSLMRRINRRMDLVNIKKYENYIDYLEVHPDEFSHLFNSILINVTSFFRDPPAWNYLSHEVIPRVIESKKPADFIRIWSAGCASGEEAYTLVITLAEALGLEQFRKRVKVYATDVDEDALVAGRQATYTAKDLAPVSQELKEKYFEPVNSRYLFRGDLRRSVNFGRHDLIQDAPISRLDLLVCRNTLMYFNAETQASILTRFHFALNPGGFLFLGKAELLLTHAKLFTPLDMTYRIFSKADLNARDRLFTPPQAANHDIANQLALQNRLRDAALEASPNASIVVDFNSALVLATQKARSLFGLIPRDIGRPIHELEICYRPAELRPLIEQAYAERRTVTLNGVERRFNDSDAQFLDVQVTPLFQDTGSPLGVSVSYLDISPYVKLREELEHANQELETSSEELQSTNEELETTNEELQSTNEELQTTNEELQSTNEELETMNEELQSTNEELQTVNEEMRQQSAEIDNANSFLKTILSTMRAAIIVLDGDMNILIWNHKS